MSKTSKCKAQNNFIIFSRLGIKYFGFFKVGISFRRLENSFKDKQTFLNWSYKCLFLFYMHFHHQLNNQWKYYSTSICVGDNSVNSVSKWVWAPGKKCSWRVSCKTKGQGDDAGREEISNLEFNDQSTDSSLRKEYGTLHLTFVEQSARTMKQEQFC